MHRKIIPGTVTKRDRISFVLWTAASLAFCLWLGNWWLFVLLLLFFFDLYISRLIPWRWWQKSQSKAVRSTMSLIEDIVVVLILVSVLNLFFFQMFKIPTSSLEKTNLVGDHLIVSKVNYGPRVPMTPLALPLVHNQIPGTGAKSFSEAIKLPYRRLKGFEDIKRGDIVVFNFPAGDTVPTKVLNPDYYTLVSRYGRERIWGDRETFGEIIYRPVDMRDHYVKRLVGMPGDTLQVKANTLIVNGESRPWPKEAQLNYFVQTKGGTFSSDELDKLGISKDDIFVLDGSDPNYLPLYRALRLEPDTTGNVPSYGMVYHFPLTRDMLAKLEKHSAVKKIVVEPDPSPDQFTTYPLDADFGWTRDNYGPIWIPKKGATVKLTRSNLPLYERVIRNFEGHALEVKGSDILIDGKPASEYTFGMDYFFMMGDNRHNSADSRAWGFVPEDHIVGKPILIWISIDKNKPFFKGGFRWDRFLKKPSAD